MAQNQTILLMGSKPDNLEGISAILRQIGYNILFAGDGREGLRLICRELPDLVISEINLPVISGLELCHIIRRDQELWATPLMFLCNPNQSGKILIEILRAGADELLAEFSNSEHLAVKIAWLIKRKYSERYLSHFCEILHGRQTQITQIIKDTSNLFDATELAGNVNFDDENNHQALEKNLGKRMRLGINTLGALANLLEEQVKALDIWRRSQNGEDFDLEVESSIKTSELNYDDLTFDFIKDDLPVN